MAAKKGKAEIKYLGQYAIGSNLFRVIVYHYDEGHRLLGTYEIWATKEVIKDKHPGSSLKFNEKLRSFAIDGFEELIKYNDEKSTKHTAIFFNKNKPPKYGNYREFPGVISDIDPTVRTNVSMPESLYQWVRLQAAKERSSVSEVTSQALSDRREIACPSCGGNNVGKTGLSHGVGAGPKPPKCASKQYECLDCKEFFSYPRLSN